MINSDSRNKMTQLQMAFILFVIGSGISLIRAPQILVQAGGHSGWLAVFPGAVVYFIACYFIIRLMDSFPQQSLVEFLPQLVGKIGTHVFVWFWVIIVLTHITVRIQSFGREVTYFLFDRTPLEVVILTFLLSTTFGASQDWGTLLRVTQIIGFAVVPFLILFLLFGAINMHMINLFPIWPEDPLKLVTAVPKLWDLFSGYEMLIVLFPLVVRPPALLLKYAAGAFLIRASLMLLATLTTIGVLSAEGIKNTTYPTLMVVRLAELPGTFLERLDNFLLISWIPIAYITVSIYIFCLGKIVAELFRFSDHRPIVFALHPILFISVMSLHDLRISASIHNLSIWLGLAFSFGAVPTLLVIKYLKDRRKNETRSKPI